jgi:hypothetical protein
MCALDSGNGDGRIVERLETGALPRLICYQQWVIASLLLLPKVTATGGKNGTSSYEDGTTQIGPSGPRAISRLLTRPEDQNSRAIRFGQRIPPENRQYAFSTARYVRMRISEAGGDRASTTRRRAKL